MNPNDTGEDAKPYLAYKEMVEKELVLQDRTVKALACHFKDDARIWTYIVYDDVLVMVSNSPADEWFRGYPLKKFP